MNPVLPTNAITMEPCFSCQATSIHGFLRFYFNVRISFVPGSVTLKSDEFWGGEYRLEDLRVESAIVLAAIKRVLGWGHLIDTVFAVYGEEPEDLYELVCSLSSSARISPAHADRIIDEFRSTGRCHGVGKGEKKLTEWNELAISILREEFVDRGAVLDPLDSD